MWRPHADTGDFSGNAQGLLGDGLLNDFSRTVSSCSKKLIPSNLRIFFLSLRFLGVITEFDDFLKTMSDGENGLNRKSV